MLSLETGYVTLTCAGYVSDSIHFSPAVLSVYRLDAMIGTWLGTSEHADILTDQ